MFVVFFVKTYPTLDILLSTKNFVPFVKPIDTLIHGVLTPYVEQSLYVLYNIFNYLKTRISSEIF